ncbi:MAG: hypothetical protein KatS3mg056_0842 [Chloroflexus sp.]|jgi:hypothetical protein|nr:MAG: hypothetical protein KatS3mg056_0842 [Chloroflexus sp.]
MVQRGSAMHAVPGDTRAGGSRSQGKPTGLVYDGAQVERRSDVGLRFMNALTPDWKCCSTTCIGLVRCQQGLS